MSDAESPSGEASNSKSQSGGGSPTGSPPASKNSPPPPPPSPPPPSGGNTNAPSPPAPPGPRPRVNGDNDQNTTTTNNNNNSNRSNLNNNREPNNGSNGETRVRDTMAPPGEGKSSSRESHKAISPPASGSGKNVTEDQIKLLAGVSAVLILMCVCCCCRKKKKKQNVNHVHYYGEYPPPGQHPPPPPHQKWQQSQIPPPSPPMGMNYSGGGQLPGSGWQGGPPMSGGQLPMSSGDMNSANYSNLQPPPPPPPTMSVGFNQSTFTYDELMAATGGFVQTNLLGQGGFGYVHKGVLPNGKEVAVKSLKTGSGQGEREFMAEVEIISRVHHRHLVSLVGYSITDQQRLLVYEFLPNDTLEHHLHGRGLPIMDFPTRLKIALGSAKGLAYLHEDCHPKIIHRDIKSSNILLDLNFEAKVADFGLAKLSTDNHTHVSTRVMGTFGYLAPEYASSGKLTEKSDVFSFGIMLLELITGKRPVDPTNVMEDSLVDWARPLLTRALDEGNFNELVDLKMEGNFNHSEMHRMIACAAASIRHSAKKRPKMSQIVHTLEGDASLDDLNDGIRPGQSSAFRVTGSGSDYDIGAYNADMARFRQMALASQEFDSSEHGTGSSSSDSRDLAPAALRKYNL
ncbi:Proline-rich receptor-like protein kinase PERK4 [Linum perenne]